MTTRDDLRECRARNAKLTTTVEDLTRQLAQAQTDATAKETELAEMHGQLTTCQAEKAALESRIAELEAVQPTPEPEPEPEPFMAVPLGANLQTVAKAAGEGANLQLPVRLQLTGSLTPLQGQHFRGPCEITPAPGANIGFAINCKTNEAEDVILENLDVSGFQLRGLQPWAGNLIKGGRYHHNGEMGIGVDMNGRDLPEVVLDGVETDHNGSTEVLGHGAGGVKFFHVRRSRVIDCNTHDNTGNGWWWDAECGDAVVQGGQCVSNLRKGLFWEKCGGAHASSGAVYDGLLSVEGVTFSDNNQEKSQQGNAGIYCVASKNMIVARCTFGGNLNAIVVRNDADRLTGQHADHPGWVTSNVEISDSTNVYNGDKVVVGPDVQGVRRT